MEIKIHCIIHLQAFEFSCYNKRNRSDKHGTRKRRPIKIYYQYKFLRSQNYSRLYNF